MSLPALPVGFIIVYGSSVQGQSGLTPENTRFRFGTVYQIFDGCVNVYGGDSVMYNTDKVTCKLAIAGEAPKNYNMIPARLVTKEFIAP